MNEKKKYTAPTAEKLEFDYTESVVACPSSCKDQSHWWHNRSWNNSGENDANPTQKA